MGLSFLLHVERRPAAHPLVASSVKEQTNAKYLQPCKAFILASCHSPSVKGSYWADTLRLVGRVLPNVHRVPDSIPSVAESRHGGT